MNWLSPDPALSIDGETYLWSCDVARKWKYDPAEREVSWDEVENGGHAEFLLPYQFHLPGETDHVVVGY
jgi:hypothetical protein